MILPLLFLALLAGTAAAQPVITEIIVTAAGAPPLASQAPPLFADETVDGPLLTVDPNVLKQTVLGLGTSVTESSAFVLAHLEPARRRGVIARLFGPDGADFPLARTHLGACDFSVEGKYSYADVPVPGDDPLAAFTLAPDSAGFDPAAHPGLRAPAYDLLPMLRESHAAGGAPLRVVGSAWTAPPWMKDIGTWSIPGDATNGWVGTGGALLPEHRAAYADYLVRAVDAFAAAGAPLWALTPVNEPHGNGGYWESMHMTPGGQKTFVQDLLGPRLRRAGHDMAIYVYDQNRDGLEDWADAILGDPRSRGDVTGIAVHWYSGTEKVFEDAFERVHARFPEFGILHTEGCIDNLGVAAPGGIRDPDGYQEEGWFMNDAFWWGPNATDWAYTAEWAGPGAADHPAYVPVHRYARDIIVGLDHWLEGWIDWNAVLDRHGGPNHVGNFCGAPIMIDTATGEVYETPVFHVLLQLSRSIRPGDRAVATRLDRADLGADDLHACAVRAPDGRLAVQVLNTTARPVMYGLRLGDRTARIEIPANAVQTVRVTP